MENEEFYLEEDNMECDVDLDIASRVRDSKYTKLIKIVGSLGLAVSFLLVMYASYPDLSKSIHSGHVYSFETIKFAAAVFGVVLFTLIGIVAARE